MIVFLKVFSSKAKVDAFLWKVFDIILLLSGIVFPQ